VLAGEGGSKEDRRSKGGEKEIKEGEKERALQRKGTGKKIEG